MIAFLRSTNDRAHISFGEIMGVASRLLADFNCCSGVSVVLEYIEAVVFCPDLYRGQAEYTVTEAFCSKAELRQLAEIAC